MNRAAQRMASFPFSTQSLGKGVVLPALNVIADILSKDMKGEFTGARRYKGEMASGFAKKNINTHSVGITQSAKHELQIREGTVGPYKGFPSPVVEWAESKGYTHKQASGIAKGIQKHGSAKSFSPYHPVGQPRFEYPEWAVNKHSKDFTLWARKIGVGVVSFVTTGDVYRSANIG